MILRGPLFPPDMADPDRRSALRRLARWPGVTLATPEHPLRGVGLIPLVTPLHHVIWDLSGDLRAGLQRKWRNHLAAAERRGLDLRRDHWPSLQRLVQEDSLQRRARGYQALAPGFTRALPTAALRVWDWSPDGRLGAAMCFLRHGASATYHLAWAGPEARAAQVHTLMLWQAALSLRAEGVRWLDLGSVDSDRAPGLMRFKLGTGADLRRLGATLLVLP